jgi:hypothetical protein
VVAILISGNACRRCASVAAPISTATGSPAIRCPHPAACAIKCIANGEGKTFSPKWEARPPRRRGDKDTSSCRENHSNSIASCLTLCAARHASRRVPDMRRRPGRCASKCQRKSGVTSHVTDTPWPPLAVKLTSCPCCATRTIRPPASRGVFPTRDFFGYPLLDEG